MIFFLQQSNMDYIRVGKCGILPQFPNVAKQTQQPSPRQWQSDTRCCLRCQHVGNTFFGLCKHSLLPRGRELSRRVCALAQRTSCIVRHLASAIFHPRCQRFVRRSKVTLGDVASSILRPAGRSSQHPCRQHGRSHRQANASALPKPYFHKPNP